MTMVTGYLTTSHPYKLFTNLECLFQSRLFHFPVLHDIELLGLRIPNHLQVGHGLQLEPEVQVVVGVVHLLTDTAGAHIELQLLQSAVQSCGVQGNIETGNSGSVTEQRTD